MIWGAIFTRASGKIAEARNNVSGDPPSNNSEHTESGLLCNDGHRGGKVNEVMKLDTVENSVSDANVREVHTGGCARQ